MRDVTIVRMLTATCTGALLLFLTAAWMADPFAPVARVAYFAVYITAAAVCVAAGRTAGTHGVRWLWLGPAIATIPIAIVAQPWSVTFSDLVALTFYPLAMLSALQPTKRATPIRWARRSLDVLLTITTISTIVLYARLLGIFGSAWADELPVYRI